MVLIICDKHVEGDISADNLFTDFPELRTRSEALFSAAPRTVRAEERHVYVGQREMAVSERADWVEVLGSEDATTCHIVILRDVTSDRGVTGLGHLDCHRRWSPIMRHRVQVLFALIWGSEGYVKNRGESSQRQYRATWRG